MQTKFCRLWKERDKPQIQPGVDRRLYQTGQVCHPLRTTALSQSCCCPPNGVLPHNPIFRRLGHNLLDQDWALKLGKQYFSWLVMTYIIWLEDMMCATSELHSCYRAVSHKADSEMETSRGALKIIIQGRGREGRGRKQKWQREQLNGDVVSMQGVLELEWPFRDVSNRDKRTRPLFSLSLSPSCPGSAAGGAGGYWWVGVGECLEWGSSLQCSNLWGEAEWTFVAEPLETPPAPVWFLFPIHKHSYT